MKRKFANNSHESASKGSQEFAHHLINYLYNKLLANQVDPEIALIIAFYNTYVEPWNEAFAHWHQSLNFQMSTTDEMEIMDEEYIETKVPLWVGKIWGIYPQGTPKATALLPHQRKALISGSYHDKITGMETLIDGIGADAQLAALKSEIETYHAVYKSTYQKHVGAMKSYKDLSKDQEILRLTTTGAMLGCEGKLIGLYWKTPDKVDLFFDVSAMRQRQGKTKPEDPLTISLQPSEIKLMNLVYDFTEKLEVTNTGTKNACVFFGNTSTVTDIPDNKIIIESGSKVLIDLSALTPDMRFAYVGNLSNEDIAEMNYKLIKP